MTNKVEQNAILSTRERLLNAATELFHQRGYSQVSQRDIATAAGLQQGYLYYHFKTKQDLGVAVLDRWNQFTATSLAAFEKRRSPARQVLAYVEWSRAQEEAYFRFGCPIAKLTDELLRESGNTVEVPLVYSSILNWLFVRLTNCGMTAARADIAAHQIVAATQGAIHLAHVLRDRKAYAALQKQIRGLLQLNNRGVLTRTRKREVT